MRFLTALILSLCLATFGLEAQTRDDRSTSIVTIGGESYFVHEVDPGQTLYSIARLYEVPVSAIVDANPQAVEGIRGGQVLKIPVIREPEKKMSARKFSRLFDTHTVSQGETLYSISQLYGISVNTLIEDNEGLDPAQLSIGQVLNIRKASQGDTSADAITEQLEEYRDAVNKVSTKGVYHLVESGETIYALSRLYNVSEDDIIQANDLKDGLKAGAMIIIPVEDAQQYLAQQVLQPDSLPDSDYEDYLNRVHKADRSKIALKDVSVKSVINIAVLLPLRTLEGVADKNYTDFYNGLLLGLEDLKKEGISTRVYLYNTAKSPQRIKDILDSDSFAEPDLIIGPIYETEIEPVIEYAEQNSLPVLTPLAEMDTHTSPVLFQMAPSTDTKYDKIKALMNEDANIVYVNTSTPDTEMDSALKGSLPSGVKTLDYSRSVQAAAFNRLIDRSKENIFIVSSNNEMTVDEILAKLSSIQNNLSARSIANLDIRVVGSAKWIRFRNNIDRDLFFKLNLTYVSYYYAGRADAKVKEFDNRYMDIYGYFPTLYSYRGYDAAKLFVSAAKIPGSDYSVKLNAASEEGLLQTPYYFVQPEPTESNLNTQWALVCYKSDYTIEVH